MSETATQTVETSRPPASERRPPIRRYLEEFEVGAVYKHWPAKTVTESDDHLFCLITMNHHPLHLNDVYARNRSRAATSSSARSSTRWRWECRSQT